MRLDAKFVKEYRYTDDKPGKIGAYLDQLPADGACGLGWA
jgi:hypothetical protein